MNKEAVEKELKIIAALHNKTPFNKEYWQLVSTQFEMYFIDLMFDGIIKAYRIFLCDLISSCIRCKLFVQFINEDYFECYDLKLEAG